MEQHADMKYRVLYEAGNSSAEAYACIREETVSAKRSVIRTEITLPEEADTLRIRVTGADASVLYHLRVTAETDSLSISSNAAHVDGVTFVFDTPDAALTLVSGKKGDHMQIRFDLRLLKEGEDDARLDALCSYCNPDNPVRRKAGQAELEIIAEQQKMLDEKQRVIDETQRILNESDAALKQLRSDYSSLQTQFEQVLDSPFWKVSGPARSLLTSIRNRRAEAPAEEPQTPEEKPEEPAPEPAKSAKRLLAEAITRCDEAVLAEQRARVFKDPVTISILVPLYNTPEQFLRELIASVQAQTYPHWQLCMADASNGDSVGDIVREYMKTDSRISYQKLAENKGISMNTNACEKLAEGSYLALLDHDDLLHPSALYDAADAIETKNADFVYSDEMVFNGDDVLDLKTVHYKPDYAYDDLLGNNYICHFSVFRKDLFEKSGMLRDGYEGSQDHDLFLRMSQYWQNVVHIPEVRYYWRSHAGSTASAVGTKSYAILSGYKAVHDHLKTKGFETQITSYPKYETVYRIRYERREKPLVSVIIPNKDHYALLKNCIDSLILHTDYANYEIVIADNGSTQASVLHYYRQLERYGNVRIVHWDEPFNFAAINNEAVKFAKGKHLLFLNNDTEVISPEWMDEMVSMCEQERIGAAGALLYYKNQTIQHGGVILGPDRHNVASHAFLFYPRGSAGYMSKLLYVRDTMAVTAACMMVRKDVFEKAGGFDAETFAVAYNDIDLCMKICTLGYTNVMVPWAQLYHYESSSRGSDLTEENRGRFEREIAAFADRWGEWIDRGDPYYNRHLSFNPTFTFQGEEE
ncbi:MAG: glycosyltransferase family 2 protein [Solobacterium sp.]|nr:glycosyltransferase family 2 protein [Solobacterium sp.]